MKIVIADGDDWSGLYINGGLVHQGHSIPLSVLAEAIASRLPRLDISYENKTVIYHWLYERGDLPDDIEEVVFEK